MILLYAQFQRCFAVISDFRPTMPVVPATVMPISPIAIPRPIFFFSGAVIADGSSSEATDEFPLSSRNMGIGGWTSLLTLAEELCSSALASAAAAPPPPMSAMWFIVDVAAAIAAAAVEAVMPPMIDELVVAVVVASRMDGAAVAGSGGEATDLVGGCATGDRTLDGDAVEEEG